MSRRKQPKPRHFGAETDLAAILEDGTQPRSPVSPAIGDAHVCGKCRAEFLDLSEFLTHKKNCSHKRIVVLYDDVDKGSGNADDVAAGSPKSLMNGDLGDAHYDVGDIDDEKIATDSVAGDSMDAAMALENDGKSDLGSTNDVDRSVSPTDMNDDDEDDAMLDAEESMDIDLKPPHAPLKDSLMTSSKDLLTPLLKPEIPHPLFPFAFPGLPPLPTAASTAALASSLLPDSNVKLASLEGTKVAMAQFAENNIANLPPNADVATLQTMLYSLHQQQILQLQLLQQLQQQLMAGMAPSMAASIQAQVAGQYLLPQTTPTVGAAAPTHMSQPPSATSATTTPSSSSTTSADTAKPTIAPTSGMDKTPPTRSDTSSSSSSMPPTPPFDLPSTPKSVMNAMNEARNLFLSGKLPRPPSPLPPTPSRSPTRPVKEAGTILDRSQYAADDPFFKHKCRFCHKVFGSDSGLQIHIRSHTGERPFKCNICGNRFSTRGNLKVHFSRHKAKYPHVKMNPHPVPEHLDRLPNNPILVAPLPAMVDRDMLPPSLLPEKKPPLSQPLPGSADNSSNNNSHSNNSHSHSNNNSNRLSVTSPSVSSSNHGGPGAAHSPTPAASEAPARSSPNVSDTAAMTTGSLNSMAEGRGETKTTTAGAALSRSSPGVSQSLPGSNMGHVKPPFTSASSLTSPTSLSSSSIPASPSHHTPMTLVSPMPGQMMPGLYGMANGMPPFGFPESPFFHPPPSILPSKEEDPMEQYMEINKSETTKLEQLVQNIETKLTDPNQCAICHRILSCKSALQMHYRTHTGERPFKCKICGRAFTTKGNLKTHMGVHRAKPPMRMLHQCPVCHKQFTNALVLQQHIRMHTGDLTKDMPSLMPVPVSGADMMPGPYMPFPGFPFMPPMYPHPGAHPLQGPPGGGGGAGLSSGSGSSAGGSSSEQVGTSGELDLRKPASVKKSEDGTNSEAGSEKKHDGSADRDEKMMDVPGGQSEDNMSSAGSSNNDGFGLDGSELLEKAEKHHQRLLQQHDVPMDADVDMDAESQHGPPRSPTGDSENHDAPSRSSLLSDGELKSEHGHMSPFSSTSTTPTPTPPASIINHKPGAAADFKPPNDYLSLFSQASTMGSYLPPSTSSYSTSLMALEERVKAIEAPSPLYSYNSQRPLEQMASIVRRQEGQITPPGGAGSSHSHSPGAASQPDFDSGSTSPASMANKDAASIGGSLSPSSQTSQGNLNSSSPFHPSKMDRDAALFGLPGMGMSPYKGFGALDLTPKLYGSARPNTTCNICYKTFACKSALDIHYRSHTKDRPFKCEVCERCFSTRGNMKQHMLTHKIRDLPSEAFNNQQQPQQQGDGHSIPGSPRAKSDLITPPTTPIKDDLDRKPNLSSMPSPSDAGKHLLGMSTLSTTTPPSGGATTTTTPPTTSGGSAGSAPTSSSSTSSSNTSNSNSSSNNNSNSNSNSNSNNPDSPFVRRPNPKHVCQMCHKPFSSASALQIHIRTHTGDKPFKCTICGKAFTTKGNLKVHMGTHMWNNSPSRRGRRMSMDTLPGFPGVHTGVPPRPDEPSHFFNNFPHRPPHPPPHPPPPHGAEMYPFFPGFPNGFSPKMNEISVIQSINGNMSHLPGHPGGPPPHPSSSAEALLGRPPPHMTDSMVKHPSLPATPEAMMKAPTTPSSSPSGSDSMMKSPIMNDSMMKSPIMNDSMMKSPMMKSEMKPPTDGFLMKAPEPHVIQPTLEGPHKMDVSHHPVDAVAAAVAAATSGATSGSGEKAPKSENNNNTTNGTTNSSGELDLSLPHKPTLSSPVSSASSMSPPVMANSHNSATSSPSSSTVPVPSAPVAPPPPMSPSLQQSPESAAWIWKTTCHLCSKVCPSPAALEMHMKSHMPLHAEESSPKPLMT